MAKTLTVYLAADLKKFNSGMDAAGRKVNGFSGSLKDKLGPALIAAGAAAGAFAVKLGVDGVRSAIEDEAAVAKLATTLENLGFDDALTPLEAYIAEMEVATGIVDNELRAAFERLVRSTGDVSEAQKALQIAVDVSASKGKSLEQVADSLGKAYDGQATSLQRLGTGLSNATILSKDMDLITSELASLFQGQAAVAASTYQGQMDRLNVAVENLKEEFGRGLLMALGDTNDETNDLMDTLADLGPVIQDVGTLVGESVQDLGYLAMTFADLAYLVKGFEDELSGLPPVFEEVTKSLEFFTNPLSYAVDLLKQFRGEQNRITEKPGGGDFGEAIDSQAGSVQKANFQIVAANKYYRDFAARQQQATEGLDDFTRSAGGASSAVDKLTDKQQRLLDLYEVQGIALATSKQELIDQIGALEAATKAVEDYADAIQQDLLGGIDLAGAYGEQFDEEGNRISNQFLEAFQRQIDEANWFGNVLQAIKAKGADQTLIQELASLGPEVGGALGQQMLDQGIVPEIINRWNGVQETTKELALGLVPEFLEAGRLSAIDTLNGLANQFREDQKKFKKLGTKIGEQVGASFKKQIAKDVAEAVRAVEAAATAARAERVAAAEAEQARITEQAVATAISNLIRNSDQRSGRNVQPVLQ